MGRRSARPDSLWGDVLTRDIPVVLLTAKASDAEVWEGWEAGADFYIIKPFDVDELVHFIQYLSMQTAPPAPAE